MNWVLIKEAQRAVAKRHGIGVGDAMDVLQLQAGLYGRSLTEIARVAVHLDDATAGDRSCS